MKLKTGLKVCKPLKFSHSKIFCDLKTLPDVNIEQGFLFSDYCHTRPGGAERIDAVVRLLWTLDE